MNDLLRLISKSLHPFGYQVRPRKGLSFLRTENLEQAQHEENVIMPRVAIEKGLGCNVSGDLNKLVIYLRTCFRDNRNIDTKERLGGPNVIETSLRCIYSLIQSVKHAKDNSNLNISIVVLDDHSDAGGKARLEQLMAYCTVPFEIQTTQTTGQGQSLHEQFSHARNTDALTYFCEDDYLHEEDAILTLWQFYKHYAEQCGSHLVLYPQEHETIYSNHYPSYIVLGEDRHWRSMRHATHTFLTHGTMVERYWKYFENTKYVGVKKKRKKGSEAQTTNKLFLHLPGFSPLKPCAVHFQFEGLLPPFYDFKPLWEKSILPDDISAGP